MDKEPINKIPEDFYIAKEKQHRYQLSVTDIETGEVLYLNQGFAGIMATMESVKAFGLEVEGTHQTMAWGHPMLQMYCMDQLTKVMQKKLPEVVNELERLGYLKQSTIDDLNQWIKRKGYDNV